MAAEHYHVPVNGDYALHHDLHGHGQPNSDALGQAQSTASAPQANAPMNGGSSASHDAHDVPKHEVGWHFVKQYYTTISRHPDKWHLFYTKRSQFLFGVEAEKVRIAVGRTAVAERIKELEFHEQECKVRVSNVDTQASGDSILVQVIGEISHKSALHRKFVQSFVLSPQPVGYFVLNDMFRYIRDDDDDEDDAEMDDDADGEPAPAAHLPTAHAPSDPPGTLTNSADPAAREQDAGRIDAQLHEAVTRHHSAIEPAAGDTPATTPTSNGAAPGEPALEPTTEAEKAAPVTQESSPASAVTDERAESPSPVEEPTTTTASPASAASAATSDPPPGEVKAPVPTPPATPAPAPATPAPAPATP
ncbi:MAG: hypothetical protein M1826_002497, partial [Phylliscum demangeonii]